MTERKRELIEEIAEELKKKNYACFNYGGYAFFPNKDIKRREAYHTDIKRGQNPLVLSFPSKTVVNTVYYGDSGIEYMFNIDTYLLIDALNVLKDRSASVDGIPYGCWEAEYEHQKESEDAERSRISEELLKERAIVFKYIKGVGQLPIPDKFDVTPDQEAYFKKFDAWAKAAGDYPAVKALTDLMNKLTANQERLMKIVEKATVEVYASFEAEESKSLWNLKPKSGSLEK